MKENINIALSPNSSAADAVIALKQFFLPWNWFSWRYGGNIGKLESEFRGYFDVPFAFALNSGRESLYAILQALNFKKNDEIILQSFTCMVVVNAIVWNGLKPIYTDIDKSDFNMDVKDFEKKITKKTKAVIIQHTFGIPAKMDEIKAICYKRKLVLIEDCAHTIGGKYKGKYLGTIGDIGFFSLGRSKAISCVSGGMIVTKDKKYGEKIKSVLKYAFYPKKSVIARNLFHPIAMQCIKKLYNVGVFGKILLFFLQKVKLLTMEIEKHEKKGEFKAPYPVKMANALSKLALHQFSNLDRFNTKRKEITKKYHRKLRSHTAQSLPCEIKTRSEPLLLGMKVVNPTLYKDSYLLRFPIILKNEKKKKEILKNAKREGVVLGDWYSSPIAPMDCSMQKTSYERGVCPVAEDICSRVVNLPIYYNLNEKQTDKIIKCLK